MTDHNLAENQTPASDFVTILECSEKLFLTKQFIGGTTEAHKRSYDRAKYFAAHTVPIASPGELGAVLEDLRHKPHACLIRGARIEGVQHREDGAVRKNIHVKPNDSGTTDAPAFESASHYWAMFDDDGKSSVPFDANDLEGCARRWRDALGLGDVMMLLQFTSSQHLSPGAVRVHAFVWFSEPVSDAQLKAWCLARASTLKLDPGLYTPVQPHFVADPIFAGCEDPLASREWVCLEGDTAVFVLPEGVEIEEKTRVQTEQGDAVLVNEIGPPSDDPVYQHMRERVCELLTDEVQADRCHTVCGVAGMCAKAKIPKEETLALLDDMLAPCTLSDEGREARITFAMGAYSLKNTKLAAGFDFLIETAGVARDKAKEVGSAIFAGSRYGRMALEREANAAAAQPATLATVQQSATTLLERLKLRPAEQPPAFATGIKQIDEQLTFGGVPVGKRIIIGGAPNAGKTALALQIAEHIASQGAPVAWVAVDEDADDIDTRRVQSLGCPRATARAFLSDHWLQQVDLKLGTHDFQTYENMPIDDVIRDMASKYPGRPFVVVGDSLHTIRSSQSEAAGTVSAKARIDTIMGDVKAAQLVAPCLVILTAELARAAYRNKAQSENIEDIAAAKESGSVEYAATVMLVLRTEADGAVAVSVPKNKVGTENAFRLRLDPRTAQFQHEQATLVEKRRDGLVDTFVAVLAQSEIPLGVEKLRKTARDAGYTFKNDEIEAVLTHGCLEGKIARLPVPGRKDRYTYTVPGTYAELCRVGVFQAKTQSAVVVAAQAELSDKLQGLLGRRH